MEQDPPTPPPGEPARPRRKPGGPRRLHPKGRRGDKEKAQERRLMAFELLKGGASYRAIGKELGVSEAQAYKDTMLRMAQLAKLESDVREPCRSLMLQRCDALILGLWTAASRGHPPSVNSMMLVLERQAKLQGLDAPKKLDIAGTLMPRHLDILVAAMGGMMRKYVPPESLDAAFRDLEAAIDQVKASGRAPAAIDISPTQATG